MKKRKLLNMTLDLLEHFILDYREKLEDVNNDPDVLYESAMAMIRIIGMRIKKD